MELKDHKKKEHETEQSKTPDEELFLHSCIACNYKTNVYNVLLGHIDDIHGNKQIAKETPGPSTLNSETEIKSPEKLVFPCDTCADKFSSKDLVARHKELHFYAANLSLTFHQCRVCNTSVKKKDANIQCSKCIYFFHKKCTLKKDSRGNWKSNLWVCHICGPPDVPSIALNPNVNAFAPSDPKSSNLRPKLPTLTGRHKKSNLNLDNPETEFLKSQVDTLKSLVSQNDEEFKKLKQSNELKSKRIIQLESKLQEAHNCIAQQSKVNKTTPIIITDKDAKEDDQNPRVQLLEQKCTFIIDQLNSLFTRLDRKPETVVLCGTCEKLVSGQNLTNT